MARHVRVAAFGELPPDVRQKSAEQSLVDFVIDYLNEQIERVAPEKPDLIVLTEVCDRPNAHFTSVEDIKKYYIERGDKVLEFVCKKAIEHNCYIAFPSWIKAEDGYGRNACLMIDRKGKIIGRYDKVYPTVGELNNYTTRPGEDVTVFECDFGRVACILCFDMNFDELRNKIKKEKVDMIIFPSYYHGGLARYFYALDCRAWLICASSYHCPPEIIDPLGSVYTTSGIYYHWIVDTINLDYFVYHYDNNRPVVNTAKLKYGEKLRLFNPNYLAVGMMTYEGDDKTVMDIVKEYDIKSLDEYLDEARAVRDRLLKLNASLK